MARGRLGKITMGDQTIDARCTQCGDELNEDFTCVACGARHGLRIELARRDVDDNGESEHECFEPGTPAEMGDCMGDGWFRCVECTKLSPIRRAEIEED